MKHTPRASRHEIIIAACRFLLERLEQYKQMGVVDVDDARIEKIASSFKHRSEAIDAILDVTVSRRVVRKLLQEKIDEQHDRDYAEKLIRHGVAKEA